MLGGHFSAPIDTGSGPVLGLAVCTAFRVGERMRCDESKNIAHICRYPPQIFMLFCQNTGILYQKFENFDLTNKSNDN